MQAAVDSLRVAGVAGVRIRLGKHADLAAIARLVHRANTADHIPRIADDELAVVADRGQLIVLPLVGAELAAAACVAPGRGLVFLVIDPELASPALEHRMIAVADALCESAQGRARCRRADRRARECGRGRG